MTEPVAHANSNASARISGRQPPIRAATAKAEGRPIRYQTPLSVEGHIHAHGLYAVPEPASG